MLDFWLRNFVSLQKRINLNHTQCIDFVIFPEDLRKETGKNIEKVIDTIQEKVNQGHCWVIKARKTF